MPRHLGTHCEICSGSNDNVCSYDSMCVNEYHRRMTYLTRDYNSANMKPSKLVHNDLEMGTQLRPTTHCMPCNLSNAV